MSVARFRPPVDPILTLHNSLSGTADTTNTPRLFAECGRSGRGGNAKTDTCILLKYKIPLAHAFLDSGRLHTATRGGSESSKKKILREGDAD